MALLKETPAFNNFELAEKERREEKRLPVDATHSINTYTDGNNGTYALDISSILTTLSNELHLSEVFLWENKMFSFLSLSVIACASFSLTRMNLLYVLGFQGLFLIALCLTIRFIAGDDLILLRDAPSGRLPYPDEMESNIEGILETIVSAFLLLCTLSLRNLLLNDTIILFKYAVISILTAVVGYYVPLPWLFFHGTLLAFTIPVILKYYGSEIKKAYHTSTWIVKQMAKNVKHNF